jgi:hypothetical protein
MRAWLSQKNHRSFSEASFDYGFSHAMCDGAGCAETLMPKKIRNASYFIQFLNCLGSCFSDTLF